MTETAAQQRVRVQLMFAARENCLSELTEALAAQARTYTEQLPSTATITALTQIANDPFPASNPLCRPYEALMEIEDDGIGRRADELTSIVSNGVAELGELVQSDLSAVAVGTPVRIIRHDNETPAGRYVYLMRRRSDLTHAQYLRIYTEHARFGWQVVGITGYTQVHVDLEQSRRASRVLGLGAWQIDSVTELYIKSFDEFFTPSASREQLANDALNDELRFVDRVNSVSFCLEPVTGNTT